MRGLATSVIILGFLNFGLFVAGTFIVGGDAVNGDLSCPHVAGTYYLWDKQRAEHCHEVSREQYLYSKGHCWSVFVSWPFVMGSLFYAHYRKNKDKESTS